MKLILKHLNIKSLMLSPTTSTSNADDIEHHADNAKYWLSWRTLHIYFDFINFLTALDVFFLILVMNMHFYHTFCFGTFYKYWSCTLLYILYMDIYVIGFQCYQEFFLYEYLPFSLNFSVLIDIKASILNLLNMNWILIWMFHAIIPMTLIV